MTRARVPQVVTGLGVFLGVILIAEIYVSFVLEYTAALEFTVGVVTSIPFVVGLIAGGYRLAQFPFSRARYRRVLKWCLGGMAAFVLINGGLMAAMPPDDAVQSVAWIRWAASLGAGIGLLIGYYEAKAIHREAIAQRSAVRAEELERRRELLDYLNALLRHEVLNTANVIEGYAELLDDAAGEETTTRQYAGVIGRQATDLTRVTKDVRVLLRTIEEEPTLHRVNLSEILDDELLKVQDRYECVETEATVPDDVHVMADDLLRRIFSNLLANAVEHNDARPPRVAVTVTTTADAVTVRVADNGPGVPEAERDALFENTAGRTDHGIGLTIIGRLADRYGANVELTETGPEGSVFGVEFPRPDAETADARAASADVSA